jgi:hypothetical protein
VNELRKAKGLRLLAGVAALAALYFVARRLTGSASILADLTWGDVLPLAAACGLMVAGATVFGLTWGWLLERLLPSARRGAAFANLRAFAYCWLFRYLPATLPYLGSRVLYLKQADRPASKAAASIAYETVLQLSSGALIAMVALLAAAGAAAGQNAAYLAAAAALIPLPLLLQPRILHPLSTRALRLARRQPLPAEALLSFGDTARAFAAYCVGHVLVGTGFYIVAGTVAGYSEAGITLAIGAYTLAGVLGVLAFIFPSGLGVREAVIVAVMGLAMPAGTALTVAVVARLVAVVADIVFVALVAGVDLVLRVRASRSRPGATAASNAESRAA